MCHWWNVSPLKIFNIFLFFDCFFSTTIEWKAMYPFYFPMSLRTTVLDPSVLESWLGSRLRACFTSPKLDNYHDSSINICQSFNSKAFQKEVQILALWMPRMAVKIKFKKFNIANIKEWTLTIFMTFFWEKFKTSHQYSPLIFVKLFSPSQFTMQSSKQTPQKSKWIYSQKLSTVWNI